MSDPERVLAQALRAHAAGTPAPEPVAERIPLRLILVAAALLGLAAGAVTALITLF